MTMKKNQTDFFMDEMVNHIKSFFHHNCNGDVSHNLTVLSLLAEAICDLEGSG
jgi:hypothetical protein